jgi:hypothetical protein
MLSPFKLASLVLKPTSYSVFCGSAYYQKAFLLELYPVCKMHKTQVYKNCILDYVNVRTCSLIVKYKSVMCVQSDNRKTIISYDVVAMRPETLPKISVADDKRICRCEHHAGQMQNLENWQVYTKCSPIDVYLSQQQTDIDTQLTNQTQRRKINICNFHRYHNRLLTRGKQNEKQNENLYSLMRK